MAKYLRQAGIVGVGSAVPDKVLTNADLEKMVDTSDEWITSRTGIKERRIAGPEIAASDLATEAAQKALKVAGVQAKDLDLIILATISSDYPIPSASCIVQDKLGAPRVPAFDLAAGCSGFMYALSVASGLVSAGAHSNVLVVGVDLLSRVTDWEDRSTCVLFGDGAGAAVVAPVENEGLLAFTLGSDGSGAHLLRVEGGGSRLPTSAETVKNDQHYLRMAGAEVFKFAVRIMEEATRTVVGKCDLTVDDIDLLIPHQANIRIIEAAARRLEFPQEKIFSNVHKYGNTSAASIPIAIDEAYRDGRIKQDDLVVMVGFGAGLTWGAGAMRWVM